MELSEFADNINEVDREKPYDAETFRTAAINKLKYLYKIRDLMESEDYNKKRKQFEKETERLFAAIDKLTEHIGIFEEEETDRIIKDDTLTEEEKKQKMQSEVYSRVREMYDAVENTKEYRAAAEKIIEFRENNKLMEDSAVYNLKRTSPKTLPFVDMKAFFAGEEGEEIQVEIPSDCIYDAIEKQEKYVESGYSEDYKKAKEEDARQKKLSELQLNYLFKECDTVCFHAEKDIKAGYTDDVRFAEITEKVYGKENVENRGMQVLRIYLKPTRELKEYLSSFIRFDRYHYDVSEKFAPFVSFADVRFLKDGVPLLDCLTHEGYFDVHDSIKGVFEKFEKESEST